VKRAAFAAVVLLLAGCASTPRSIPASPPAAAATSGVAPTGQPSTGPTYFVSRAGPTVQFDGWTATCSNVPADECHGVAALFVNNLAWSGQLVLDASRGQIIVASRSACPALPNWADPSHCWQATARVAAGPVCMVIARWPKAEGAVSKFGQVGGDDMSGELLAPPGWPTCE
jgi:hypothetical protein